MTPQPYVLNPRGEGRRARPWTFIRSPKDSRLVSEEPAASLIAEVAARHGVRVSEVEGRSQHPDVFAARCEAMALIYGTGQYGTVDVGSFFDCRDHSTVCRAIRKHWATSA